MRIRIGYDLRFNFVAPTALLLKLFVHPSRVPDLIAADELYTAPEVPVEMFRDEFGNRCARLTAPPGQLRLHSKSLVRDSGEPEETAPEAAEIPVSELPVETLPFLLASRYCETDLLIETATTLFGHLEPGWSRVQAICDWVHENVAFDYMRTRVGQTAHDTFQNRAGVCRDITHLAVAFCRCLNIPARYASGYLGDIGIPPEPYPMDFNAWFEAYLGGRWHLFDPRHNMPRIGRILMVRGRDAADTAMTTCFGLNALNHFEVWTDEVEEA